MQQRLVVAAEDQTERELHRGGAARSLAPQLQCRATQQCSTIICYTFRLANNTRGHRCTTQPCDPCARTRRGACGALGGAQSRGSPGGSPVAMDFVVSGWMKPADRRVGVARCGRGPNNAHQCMMRMGPRRTCGGPLRGRPPLLPSVPSRVNPPFSSAPHLAAPTAAFTGSPAPFVPSLLADCFPLLRLHQSSSSAAPVVAVPAAQGARHCVTRRGCGGCAAGVCPAFRVWCWRLRARLAKLALLPSVAPSTLPRPQQAARRAFGLPRPCAGANRAGRLCAHKTSVHLACVLHYYY